MITMSNRSEIIKTDCKNLSELFNFLDMLHEDGNLERGMMFTGNECGLSSDEYYAWQYMSIQDEAKMLELICKSIKEI